MKKIFVLCFPLFLASCAGFEKLPEGHDFGPPPVGYEEAVKARFQYALKDPNSAMYRIGTPYTAYSNTGLAGGGGIAWSGYAVNVQINAKNSYGGYTGYQPYRVLFSGDRAWYHCKVRTSLDESVFDTCNDTLFNRVY